MIQCTNVRLQFGARVLFEDVNIKFTKGNCYGIIGANCAGKSTFLKLLTGELTPSSGDISITKGERMSVLEQNQNAYNDKTALEVVLLGHKKLVDMRKELLKTYQKQIKYQDDLRKKQEDTKQVLLKFWSLLIWYIK